MWLSRPKIKHKQIAFGAFWWLVRVEGQPDLWTLEQIGIRDHQPFTSPSYLWAQIVGKLPSEGDSALLLSQTGCHQWCVFWTNMCRTPPTYCTLLTIISWVRADPGVSPLQRANRSEWQLDIQNTGGEKLTVGSFPDIDGGRRWCSYGF